MLKTLIPAATRHLLRNEWAQLRDVGPFDFVRWNWMMTDAWLRDRANRRGYTMLDEPALRATRRADTVFVFGTGYSLNDITPAEWAWIAGHDVFGFNSFYHQRWVPAGFLLMRGGAYTARTWRPLAEERTAILRTNPMFAQTIYIMQGDEFTAWYANQLVGYRLMPEGARIFRYHTARGDGPPTRSFSEGLRHTSGTLSDAVNAAFCMGWREIVLTGIDLYDSRHFYLRPDETLALDATSGRLVPAEVNNMRGNRYDQPHNTTRIGVVDIMRTWAAWLRDEGVRLSVYNPRSLLAEVLPVYQPPLEARP